MKYLKIKRVNGFVPFILFIITVMIVLKTFYSPLLLRLFVNSFLHQLRMLNGTSHAMVSPDEVKMIWNVM